jgi:hypothetical protein
MPKGVVYLDVWFVVLNLDLFIHWLILLLGEFTVYPMGCGI